MKRLWVISKTIAVWQARIILSVIYFVFAVPMSLFVRRKQGGGWQSWPYPSDSMDDLSRQF